MIQRGTSLRLVITKWTRNAPHLRHPRIRAVLRSRSLHSGRPDPWWISHWQMEPALLRLAAFANRRRRSDPGRPSDTSGFLRPIRHRRPRHARAGLSNPPSGRDRMVSLRSKSDVCRGTFHHHRPSSAVRNIHVLEYGVIVWLVASLLRAALRGTDNARDLRRRIPTSTARTFRAGFHDSLRGAPSP